MLLHHLNTGHTWIFTRKPPLNFDRFSILLRIVACLLLLHLGCLGLRCLRRVLQVIVWFWFTCLSSEGSLLVFILLNYLHLFAFMSWDWYRPGALFHDIRIFSIICLSGVQTCNRLHPINLFAQEASTMLVEIWQLIILALSLVMLLMLLIL